MQINDRPMTSHCNRLNPVDGASPGLPRFHAKAGIPPPPLLSSHFSRTAITDHYHKGMGKPAVNIDNGPSGHACLPVFEDAVSIQSAISDVCEMMLHRRIEAKEASILLYAMQVASTNMAHMNGDKGQRQDKSKSKKKTSAEPSSSAALSSKGGSTASSAISSSEPQPLPPGTIQACEQKGRQAFE
jgi:hypothetical protein